MTETSTAEVMDKACWLAWSAASAITEYGHSLALLAGRDEIDDVGHDDLTDQASWCFVTSRQLIAQHKALKEGRTR